MKDSQHSRDTPCACVKYIKANNERFSTIDLMIDELI